MAWWSSDRGRGPATLPTCPLGPGGCADQPWCAAALGDSSATPCLRGLALEQLIQWQKYSHSLSTEQIRTEMCVLQTFNIYCLIFHTGCFPFSRLAKTMEKPHTTAANHQHGCHVSVLGLLCPGEQLPHRMLGAGFISEFIFFIIIITGMSSDFSTFQVHSPPGRCLSLSGLS